MSIRLDQTTVLIGENNTGKSTILDAVQLALGGTATNERIRFTKYDHYLAASDSHASDSDPIEIVLHFSEQIDKEWPDNVIQKLGDVIQQDDITDRHSVTLRVRSKYDATTDDSVPEWDFLNLNKESLGKHTFRYKKTLQSLVPVFSLKSKRDSDRAFKPNSTFWGPFVRAVSMDPGLLQSLEHELASLNQRIIKAHKSFSAVKESLQDITKLVPLASSDPVSIAALPSKVLDILSQTRVSLSSITGAKIPVEKHGEGTQSLATICLFVAFLKNKIDGQDSDLVSAILTLEEPEAHLHPSAIHSVTNLLESQYGQNIIATHSGDLVSSVEISALRCLRRKDGEVAVYPVDRNTFSPKDRSTIDHHIRMARGNMLFARCWLLVEGKTESLVFERCAAICGIDLAREGVYCVEYPHISSPRTLIKFAKQIGIEWFVVADGDDAGNGYVQSAEGELHGEDKEKRICQLKYTFDVMLCMEGYGHHYERHVSSDTDNQTFTKDAAYWKAVVGKKSQLKTAAASSAVEEMCETGKDSVPEIISRIITTSIQLARGA